MEAPVKDKFVYYLFLDDERKPDNVTWIRLPRVDWVIVSSYDEFVAKIQHMGAPAFVSFDHDLADEHYQAMLAGCNNYGAEKTGYECAKWLVDFCIETNVRFPDYVVHSMNPIGAKRISDYVEWAKQKVPSLNAIQ